MLCRNAVSGLLSNADPAQLCRNAAFGLLSNAADSAQLCNGRPALLPPRHRPFLPWNFPLQSHRSRAPVAGAGPAFPPPWCRHQVRCHRKLAALGNLRLTHGQPTPGREFLQMAGLTNLGPHTPLPSGPRTRNCMAPSRHRYPCPRSSGRFAHWPGLPYLRKNS